MDALKEGDIFMVSESDDYFKLTRVCADERYWSIVFMDGFTGAFSVSDLIRQCIADVNIIKITDEKEKFLLNLKFTWSENGY
jgi:hypothetical protein